MKRTLFFIGTMLVAAGCQRSDDRDARSSARETTGSTPSANSPSSTTLANRPAINPSGSSTVPATPRAESTDHSHDGTEKGSEHDGNDKAADDTGKNERDRSGSTATSGDQGGSDADRRVTQQIRKTVVDDEKLSTTAKNVKIITENGAVTLRGPVKSSQERTEIAAIAQKVHGVKRVDNQLEVANK